MNKIKKPEIKKIHRKILDKNGIEKQFGILMGKCGELISATSKITRKDTTENWDTLAESMAETEIAIDVMKTCITWMLLKERVENAKQRKLKELSKKGVNRYERART